MGLVAILLLLTRNLGTVRRMLRSTENQLRGTIGYSIQGSSEEIASSNASSKNTKHVGQASLAAIYRQDVWSDDVTEEPTGLHVITGVAGYIGSHMALTLLQAGKLVVGVDNMSRGSSEALEFISANFPETFTFEMMDLGDSAAVRTLLEKYHSLTEEPSGSVIETLYHFAAVASVAESVHKPHLYYQNNTMNTMILVDALLTLKQAPRFVFASTCAVYGSPPSDMATVDEMTPAAPLSPYGSSKWEAEKYIQNRVANFANTKEHAFSAHIFRFANVVGSGLGLREIPAPALAQYNRLWTTVMSVVKGESTCVPIYEAELYGRGSPDGSAIRDYVHVMDIVQGILAVLKTHPNPSLSMANATVPVWNLGTGNGTSTIQFIEAARRVTGIFIPACFGRSMEEGEPTSPPRPANDTMAKSSPARIVLATDKMRAATGWQPTYKSIDVILNTAWKSQPFHVRDGTSQDTVLSQEYDVCIVGAGLSAAVLAERHSSVYNHSVMIVEKRDHIGGNMYDYIDKETGIRVSKYGVHLFHTQYDRVWEYLQRFSRWTKWEHHCVALVGDKYVPVPINIDSINSLYDLNISTEEEMNTWLQTKQIEPPSGEAVNSEEVGLQRVGRDLYDTIFKPYTIKQWNKDPKDLNPSVLARIPVRNNHDDRYFTDPHQALPTDGYTRIFENLYNSPRVSVRLNTDYFNVQQQLKRNCGHLYFTGPIDAYFAAKGLPKLEYRSLRFERVVYRDTDYFQPRAHVNYPSLEYNYTRAIEYKHILNQRSRDSVVFFEYSTDIGEPYYPVPNPNNHALYAKYQEMAEEEDGVTFVGRLANYKYFNMDQTVLNALELFDKQENFKPKCTPGSYESPEQWKSLFPGGSKGFGLKQKALIFMPVGRNAAEHVDKLVETLGLEHYHFLLCTYDDFDWTTMAWHANVDFVVQPSNSGTNWAMAKLYLTPERVAPYSHVFVWDDDMTPAEGFDGAIFLQWLQQLGLEIAQPMVNSNGHEFYEGTVVKHRSPDKHVHEVDVVEIMVPCYETKMWSSCIWPKIVQERSTGWGIDLHLHRADCGPENVYSVRLPLDHNDQGSLSKGPGMEELEEVHNMVKERGWGRREYTQPFRDFNVQVDEDCKISLGGL